MAVETTSPCRGAGSTLRQATEVEGMEEVGLREVTAGAPRTSRLRATRRRTSGREVSVGEVEGIVAIINLGPAARQEHDPRQPSLHH